MKYLFFLVALIVTACQLTVQDSPALRSAIEAKFGATVAPESVLPGTLKITLLTPPAPPIEPQLVPTVTPTPECLIKGNVSSSGERIAHSPGQANYDNVVISPERGEKMFCTLDEAIAEGWRAAQR